MREKIKRLQSLQALDAEIFAIKKELAEKPARLNEVLKIAELRKKDLAQKSDEKKSVESEKGSQEQILFVEQDKLKKIKSRLTGTNVRNAGAYYANQREIDKMKKDMEAVEAVLLEKMQKMEELSKSIASLETQLAELDAKRSALAAEVETESKRLNSEMEAKLTTRAELALGVDKQLLSDYERIHTRFPDTALCKALSERCMGCYMHIPPQLYNEIIRGEKMHKCPACLRILYYEAEDPKPEKVSG